MEKETIERPVTEADKQFFDVNLNKPKRQKTSREKFTIKLHQEEQKATKAHLPFAAHAARDDFEGNISTQIGKQRKAYGSIEYPEKLTVPKMDWKKYSDLKNFIVEKEYEKNDTSLTNRNPGLFVALKTTVYKYQDYGNTYRVMEEPADAIKRAQEKVWKAQKQTK